MPDADAEASWGVGRVGHPTEPRMCHNNDPQSGERGAAFVSRAKKAFAGSLVR